MRESINEMIKQILDICITWVKQGEDELFRFIDPIDSEEISAHYGATHAAASFIMYGEKNQNKELAEIGYKLLTSIVSRWNSIKSHPEFHNDFNNFALCVIWNYFDKNNEQDEFIIKIKELVLNTPDSKNPTVNWFPMRWYVNLFRYKWTGIEKYKKVCDECRKNIKAATYEDGFIDDRLPIGLSFNLQYDVATVALLQYLRSTGEKIDISVELGALINAVSPDGDINYLGRGTNQIFAWGLWIYLLASSGKKSQLQIALNYIKNKIPVMLQNNNMMLNEWAGEEKYMWWDYHYCSVYTAHLLFWLLLAMEQMDLYPVKEKVIEPRDSGVKIYRDTNYFIVTFDGRREYLAENGPCIVALWTQSAGMIIKGTFGPWQGAFGNKYNVVEATIRNFCGVYSVVQNKNFFKNRYIRKMLPNLKLPTMEKVTPLFERFVVSIQEECICIKWKFKGNSNKFLSVPCIENKKSVSVRVDGKIVRTVNSSLIRNQYTWVKLLQTDILDGTNWELIIRR